MAVKYPKITREQRRKDIEAKPEGERTPADIKFMQSEHIKEQLGEEKFAELQTAENRPEIEISPEERRKILAGATTVGKGMKAATAAAEIGVPTTPGQEQAMLEEALRQKNIKYQEEFKVEEETAGKQLRGVGEAIISPNLVQTLPEKLMPFNAALEAIGGIPLMSDVFSLWKKFGGGFVSGKKMPSTQDMESSFITGRTAIADEFAKMKAGELSTIDFHAHLRMMNNAIAKMERRLKFANSNKVLYYLTDGKDIEEELIGFKQTLSAYNIELIKLAAKGVI